MKTTTKTLVAAAVLACGATVGHAKDKNILPKDNAEFVNYGEESGWNIFVDKSRNTCLIERVDENTNVVQMGLTPDKDFGYMGVFTKADIEFEDDKVELLMDNKLYYGDTTAAPPNLANGYKGGYLLANNPDFVTDVMERETMIVMPESNFAFEISLAGTKKAIEAARECNASLTN